MQSFMITKRALLNLSPKILQHFAVDIISSNIRPTVNALLHALFVILAEQPLNLPPVPHEALLNRFPVSIELLYLLVTCDYSSEIVAVWVEDDGLSQLL